MRTCNQCGKCCINYADGGLSASADEIDWWETQRPEIFRYVHNGKIWMSPTTGDQLKQCPWLIQSTTDNTYSCQIYFDRPNDCKYYPVNVAEMIMDDCEMLETSDLKNPQAAQEKLDIIMSDSRPAHG